MSRTNSEAVHNTRRLSTDRRRRPHGDRARTSLGSMPFFERSPHGVVLRADAVREFGRHRVAVALAGGEVLAPWRGVLVDAKRAANALTIVSAARLAIGAE